MNTKKVLIIIAACLIAAGLLVSISAMAAIGFDFTKMNAQTLVTNTAVVDSDFTSIYAEGAECDIVLAPSSDNTCRVEFFEGDKISHSVAVVNDTLTIKRRDDRKWYERMGIYWGSMEITVYLPKDSYESLYLKSASGDIRVPEDFSFANAEVHNTSGNIAFYAPVTGNLIVEAVSGNVVVTDVAPSSLEAKSTSGNVAISSVSSAGELTIKSVSGDVKLSDITCRAVTANSTSGDVFFGKVYARDSINVKSVSGDIKLQDVDAGTLFIKTTSGDVSGALSTEKIFLTDTQSGDVNVPQSLSGAGICEIKTTSGDINFSEATGNITWFSQSSAEPIIIFRDAASGPNLHKEPTPQDDEIKFYVGTPKPVDTRLFFTD